MAATISSSNAKVEIHRTIDSLSLDDPSAAWDLLKTGLESKIGKDKYICVPFITEDGLFDITTVFVKVEQTGRPGIRYRTYKALGKIESMLNRDNSLEVWHDISERIPEATPFDLDTPLEVVVRDDVNHICVSTVFRDITKQTLPREFVVRRAIQLDVSGSSELQTAKKIYLIDEVVLSRNIEIRIYVGDDARSFFREAPHTIAFHYKKLKLSEEKLVLRAVAAKVNSLRTNWLRPPGYEDQDSGFVASPTRPSSVFVINRNQSEKSSLEVDENADEASVNLGSFNKRTNATDDAITVAVN